MAYTPINLADVYGAASQIKGMQQRNQLADLQLQEAQKSQADSEAIDQTAKNPNATLADFSNQGMAGVQAYGQLSKVRSEDLLQQNRKTYVMANQVAGADDPIAAAKSLAPDFVKQWDQIHGQGSFDSLTPDQVKQAAGGIAQHALLGLVDPDKQFQANQEMNLAKYKQQGPGGEADRNANTVNAENARTQFVQGREDTRAAALRNVTLRGQDLGNARDLKPVTNQDGTVTYAPADQAAGMPVGSTSGATGGARMQVMFSRVSGAGNEVAQALHNISRLPTSANSGLFGLGNTTHGFLATTRAALYNTLSTQDTQRYNTMVSGIQRNLASIEAAGLNPGESLTSSMQSVVLKPGDTELEKLTKMAEIRQIAEKGLEGYLVNPVIPPQQKKQVQGIIDKMQKAIPYTQDDITDLIASKDPKATIADVAKARGLGNSSAGGGAIPGNIQALLDKYK